MKPRPGFTLFEVLVALTLFLVVMGALVGVLRVNLFGSKETASNAQLQTDSQAATLLLGNRMRDAVYVYPTGSALDLPNQDHMKNYLSTSAGTTRWTVGTGTGQDRGFRAMLLPPQNPRTTCTNTSTQGCYMFYAYYPIPRNKLLSATNLNALQKPSLSTANQNQLVLMEYRSMVAPGGLTADNYFNVTTPPTSAAVATGESRMLLDLVTPAGFQFTQDTTRNTVTLTYSLADLVPPAGRFPVTGTQTVTFNARNWQ